MTQFFYILLAEYKKKRLYLQSLVFECDIKQKEIFKDSKKL